MLLNLAFGLIFLNEIRARDTRWNILSHSDLWIAIYVTMYLTNEIFDNI